MTRNAPSFLLLATLALLLPQFNTLAQGDLTPQEAAQKFGTLMRYVNQLNVVSVDVEDLTENDIVIILEDLYHHSVYSLQTN